MIKQAIFTLGDEKYGLDIMDISTIEKTTSVEPKAALPANFKGVINLRGDIVPVYSLRRRFGFEDIPYDEETRFIIGLVNEMPVAFEVDRVVEILQIEDELLYTVPEVTFNKDNIFMKNVVNYDGRLVIILDPKKILTEQEQDVAQNVVKNLAKKEDNEAK